MSINETITVIVLCGVYVLITLAKLLDWFSDLKFKRKSIERCIERVMIHIKVASNFQGTAEGFVHQAVVKQELQRIKLKLIQFLETRAQGWKIPFWPIVGLWSIAIGEAHKSRDVVKAAREILEQEK